MGFTETAFSIAPGAFGVSGAALAPANSVPPSIAVQGGGSPMPGAVLEMTAAGTWSGSPTLSYQWQQDGLDIEGETSPSGFTILEGTEQSEIRLLEIPDASVKNGVASNGIIVVPVPPVNISPPGISDDGSTTVGAGLTLTTPGTWDTTYDMTYAWFLDGTERPEVGTGESCITDAAGLWKIRETATNSGTGGVAHAFSNEIQIDVPE